MGDRSITRRKVEWPCFLGTGAHDETDPGRFEARSNPGREGTYELAWKEHCIASRRQALQDMNAFLLVDRIPIQK